MKVTRRVVAALSAIVAVVGLSLIPSGVASAHDQGRSTVSVLRGNTAPVPNLNNGESATFRVFDNGRTLTIVGSGRGMAGAKSYVSLIYTDNACSQVTGYGNTGLSVNGAWQDHGDGRQFLLARYDGDAYQAVKGKVQSVSIREVTSVTIPPPNGPATAILTPRACADVA